LHIKKNQQDLEKTLIELNEIDKKYKNVSLFNKSKIANQEYLLASSFSYMIVLAKIITKASLYRNESRGAFYKEGFIKDDKNFLKTTIVSYINKTDEIDIKYKDVDLSYFDPINRDYQSISKIPKMKTNPKFLEKLL
jgi:succinate dehydrogenase/fumarate reductase flavoprotein subunit